MERVSGGRVVPLVYKKAKPYGVSPRNDGQYFMQEALMTDADTAPLVIIKGDGWNCKNILCTCSRNGKKYITIHQKNIAVSLYAGLMHSLMMILVFLPGDEKKIAPLMRPVIDNLEQILDSDEKERYEDEAELSDKITEVFERRNYSDRSVKFYSWKIHCKGRI